MTRFNYATADKVKRFTRVMDLRAFDQAHRVRMLRTLKELLGGSQLDEFAGVEHGNSVCHAGHNPEVVCDPQDAHA
jgi:hypothetical protein